MAAVFAMTACGVACGAELLVAVSKFRQVLARFGSLHEAFAAICGQPQVRATSHLTPQLMGWQEFRALAAAVDVNDRIASQLWATMLSAIFGKTAPADDAAITESSALMAPAPGEAPAAAEAPMAAEAPALAEAPAAAEAETPVPTEAPVPAETPEASTPVDAGAPTETPVAAETPALAEAPVPAEAETPVLAEAPAPAEVQRAEPSGPCGQASAEANAAPQPEGRSTEAVPASARDVEISADAQRASTSPEGAVQSPLPSHLLPQQQATAGSESLVAIRRIVPGDNSCLFTSVAYAAEELALGRAVAAVRRLRSACAEEALRDPATTLHLHVGHASAEAYATWIRDMNSWGGEPEIDVLAKHYDVEVALVNCETLRVQCYSPSSATQRVYVLYTGQHYDPIVAGPSADVATADQIYRFPKGDATLEESCLQIAHRHNVQQKNEAELRQKANEAALQFEATLQKYGSDPIGAAKALLNVGGADLEAARSLLDRVAEFEAAATDGAKMVEQAADGTVGVSGNEDPLAPLKVPGSGMGGNPSGLEKVSLGESSGGVSRESGEENLAHLTQKIEDVERILRHTGGSEAKRRRLHQGRAIGGATSFELQCAAFTNGKAGYMAWLRSRKRTLP